MHRLREESGVFYIDQTSDFRPNGFLDKEDFELSLEFAYEMTFGNEGSHRNHRSGGQARRKNGEIFADALQGKLSEFAFYNLFEYSEVSIEPPDLRIMGLSEWDSADFVANGYKIAIKSTKHFGNLLLLEIKDWDDEGRYIPNINKGHSCYDFFVLERIRPDPAGILKEKKLYYSDEAGFEEIFSTFSDVRWEANLTGFISRGELVSEVIRKRQIIPKNSYLNKYTRMDADNYYVQACDLHPMSELVSAIRNRAFIPDVL